MKFFRLVRYDLAREFFAKPAKWMLMAALAVFLFLNFFLDVLHSFWYGAGLKENLAMVSRLELSLGDELLYITGGILPAAVTSLGESFLFPVKWLLPHLLVLYITLGYTSEDLTHGGIQVITRARSRRRWWLSKCLWNILTVISCFAAGLLVLFLLALASGKTMEFSLNSLLFEALFTRPLPEGQVSAGALLLALYGMPVLVCATVSLLQMASTLYVRPVLAYAVACVYYMAGVYYASPLFLSNYAMSVRSAAVGIYNFRTVTGCVLCLILGAGAIALGLRQINRMDLINLGK